MAEIICMFDRFICLKINRSLSQPTDTRSQDITRHLISHDQPIAPELGQTRLCHKNPHRLIIFLIEIANICLLYYICMRVTFRMPGQSPICETFHDVPGHNIEMSHNHCTPWLPVVIPKLCSPTCPKHCGILHVFPSTNHTNPWMRALKTIGKH